MKNFVRRNPWSTAALLLMTLNTIGLFIMIRYLYLHGLWDESANHYLLRSWSAFTLISSIATAVVGMIKDQSKSYGVLALVLAVISIIFHAQ